MAGNSSQRKNSPDDFMTEAIAFVADNKPLPNIKNIENLKFPQDSNEAERYPQIITMLKEYAARDNVEHPLSIVVFGPPGSGKSFGVKEVLKSIEGKFVVSLSANLSQLTSTEELAQAFHEAIDELNKAKAKIKELNKNNPKIGEPAKQNSAIQKQETQPSRIEDLLKVTPVFIFDEFDTALDGVSLGWLRWFLAPMQDGKFLHNSESVSIQKAVFIFAGGTAASFDEFEKQQQKNLIEYRDKKVPDFISRLRGFIDIQGINQLKNDRAVRRALVLNRLLDNRWPGKRVKGVFPIKEELLTHLLSKVHYVHGVRSMEAILEMSAFGSQQTLGLEQLPAPDLRKLHLSRGLLDNVVIGISAGQNEKDASDFLHDLTGSLLHNGATLAYGGEFVIEGTLDWIVKAARGIPDYFVKRDDKRIRNYLGFPVFKKPGIMTALKKAKDQVQPLLLNTLSEAECEELDVPKDRWFPARPSAKKDSGQYNPKQHLAWALSLFRMRVRMIQDINALIVIGGKDYDDKSWGRFSGIAEEIMLALALKKPIYILGGRGGAARTAGKLLGMAQTLANPDLGFAHATSTEKEDIPDDLKQKYADSFTLPGHKGLPSNVAEIRKYLFKHSITSNSFWNGLDIDENREVFTTPITQSNWGECVNLIIRGLTRLDWKAEREPIQKTR